MIISQTGFSVSTDGETGFAVKTSENIRKDKAIRILRVFQVYYLAFVCFLVAYGELFPGCRFGMGRKVENLLVIPLVAAITLVVLERHLKLRFTWREALLAAFIAFVALGLLYTPHPKVVRKGLMQVVTAAVLYFLLLHAIRSGLDFKIVAGSFIAGGVLTAVLGIVSFQPPYGSGTAAWGHYNVYGAFLQMPAALALAAVIFYLKRWRVFVVLLPVLGVLFLGAYFSFSRGTWLGCVVIVIVSGILGGKRGLIVAGAIATLALLVFFLRPPCRIEMYKFSKLFSINQKAVSQRRESVWPAAVQMIGKRPIMGYGLNTYLAVYSAKRGITKPEYSKTEDPKEEARMEKAYLGKLLGNVHSHNELFQAWVSMGIAGVFFYVATFVTVLLTYIGLRRAKLKGFSAATGLGVFAWYVGHTVHGVFDCFFFFSRAFCAAAVMFALMIGTYYLEVPLRPVCNRDDSDAQPETSTHRPGPCEP